MLPFRVKAGSRSYRDITDRLSAGQRSLLVDGRGGYAALDRAWVGGPHALPHPPLRGGDPIISSIAPPGTPPASP